jgi:hypothetical protein
MNHKTVLRRAALFFMLALLLSATATTSADAAKRTVPFGFFGTMLTNWQSTSRLPDPVLDAQMARMARSGVESVRFALRWPDVEPSSGAYDFSETDRLVAAAARHGLDLLPLVLHTPRWASMNPSHSNYYLYAPTDPQLYANFIRVLIGRYGPRGSFWATSSTPRVPIRNWQVWNEPAADFFWATRPWQPAYVRLLRRAYRAIHAADRGATVLLGGLAGVTTGSPWEQLRQLYRAGAKGFFDAVSVHFFSVAPSLRLTVKQTVDITKLIRKEMRRARDRRKKVWYTELTWTAAKGKIPRRHQLGFETTPRGQAARLRHAFSRLARDRRRLGIGRVYWYNWASEYAPTFQPGGPGALTFQYSGLNKVDRANRYTPLRLLRTYARTTARYEGCRKSSNARRCRG